MIEVLVENRVSHLPSTEGAETSNTSPDQTDKVIEKENTSSDEDLDVFSCQRRKGRIMNSDNESEHSEGGKENEEVFEKPTATLFNNFVDRHDASSSDDDLSIFRKKPLKTRIADKSSSSDNEGLSNIHESPPKKREDSRIQSKQIKMKAKFNNLLQSRDKDRTESSLKKVHKSSSSDSSDDAGPSEMFSIENIKKKIEERNKTLKTTIYDPDTSDDEKAHAQEHNEKNGIRYKKKSSPKPAARMSAKQAMENMKKIKSEANRMLREREVSLPYHRPKALSLKDILARKKPATSVDGKAFSIKMNEKQLQEYAEMLEERQKLMMELCKSDSDGDDDSNCEDNELNQNNMSEVKDDENGKDGDLANELRTVEDKVANCEVQTEEVKIDVSVANDKLFDSQVSEVNNLITETDHNETEDIDPVYKTVDPEDQVPSKDNTEVDSQLISLHYSESERLESIPKLETENKIQNIELVTETNLVTEITNAVSLNTIEANILVIEDSEEIQNDEEEATKLENSINSDAVASNDTTKPNVDEQDDAFNDFLDDDEMNMDQIDRMIEDAEILEDTNTDSPMLVRDPYNPRLKPKLTGASGMLIDLDGTDTTGPKKVSGIELLKQRFVYFTNLKTPEELQKQTRNRINPGLKHLKLKHELEEQIAEQRSMEWSKRLEEEKQQQAELNAVRGDDSDIDDECDIDKLDAKLEKDDVAEASSEAETEPEENDVEIKDKPRERNALLDDEAEESESEETAAQDPQAEASNDEAGADNDNELDMESGIEQSDDESSSDDEMESTKPKKGRIIKAFEDSDEEVDVRNNSESNGDQNTSKANNITTSTIVTENVDEVTVNQEENIERSLNEDYDLQSAQLQKSISEDIFTSQEADPVRNDVTHQELRKNRNDMETIKKPDEKLAVICETQPFDEEKFDDIVGMCSGSFSQNILTTQGVESTQKNVLNLTNNELNGDLLEMCTGKFYDNQFVSQIQNTAEDSKENSVTKELAPEHLVPEDPVTDNLVTKESEIKSVTEKLDSARETSKDDNLQSILEELHDPEFDQAKQNKFFTGSVNGGHNVIDQSNVSKKRFVIDSDDEDEANKSENKVKKRKKKLEQRALQISDDEESTAEVEDEYEPALEDMEEDNSDRLVEYDSEENEVEVLTKNLPKKKSKAREFFEQEAELTSEDEWVGSGDEDEAGLDRMEREEGDDEHFHQGALQKQLGKIHMREMLDQDKREVRMIQELLLEDGDLGGGHRQRKFRWANADGGDEGLGSYIDDPTSTQEMEDEIESEEQWRRQSHERAMYLRQIMSQQKDNDLDDVVEVSFNQSAASAKANVSAENVAVTNENAQVFGKKHSRDIPSPAKKPFALLQHNSRGSILSRGDGALARLAALATPLAGETTDDGPKVTSLGPSSKRNFVFATVSPSAPDKPKMIKRKAENIGTPNLMKKLKTEERPARSAKTSLLDHIKG